MLLEIREVRHANTSLGLRWVQYPSTERLMEVIRRITTINTTPLSTHLKPCSATKQQMNTIARMTVEVLTLGMLQFRTPRTVQNPDPILSYLYALEYRPPAAKRYSAYRIRRQES